MPGWLPRGRQGRHQRPFRPFLEGLEDRCLLAGVFVQTNLASDVPGVAHVTDPNLVNPWGISSSPTGPFWFGENGAGVSDIVDGHAQPLDLVVSVPSAGHRGGTPTGTVFNGGPGFVISENGQSHPGRFLFAGEDGTISAWNSFVDPTSALVAVDNSSAGAVYKGLAIATTPDGRSFLYAANFSQGTVDVFDQDFRPVSRPDAFTDLNIPAGFAPFNVQNLNGLLYVTYAHPDGAKHDDNPGAGIGFIDVFNAEGGLVRRFTSGGELNSPWGMTVAPAGFGPFGGDLLVGNTGDGHINAFDPNDGAFLGSLSDANQVPLAIPRLWALTFGNGHDGGAANALFFTAGLDNERHGLFGDIQVPQGGTLPDTAGDGIYDPTAPGEPDDYPLPPTTGPAFQASADIPATPVAVLLPLTESSLPLVPTLATLYPPGTNAQAPATPGWSSPSSVSGIVPAAVPASANTSYLPSTSGPGLARAPGPVALNSLLDLDPSQNVSEQRGGDLMANTHPKSLPGVQRSPSPTPAALVKAGNVGAQAETLATPAVEDQGALGAEGSSSSYTVSATGLSEPAEAVAVATAEGGHGSDRKNPLTWWGALPLVGSVFLMGNYLLGRYARSETGGQAVTTLRVPAV